MVECQVQRTDVRHTKTVDYSIVPTAIGLDLSDPSTSINWQVGVSVSMESSNVQTLNVFRGTFERAVRTAHVLVGQPIHQSNFVQMSHTFTTTFTWNMFTSTGMNMIEHTKQNRAVFETMLRNAWINQLDSQRTSTTTRTIITQQDVTVRFVALSPTGEIQVEIGSINNVMSQLLRQDILKWSTNSSFLQTMME